MNWTDFFAEEGLSRDFITTKRIYVDIAGGLSGGVMLANLIWWHVPDENGEIRMRVEKEGDWWLAVSAARWWDWCRVPERTARRTLVELEERGLIKMRLWNYNGKKTTHIRLTEQFLVEYERCKMESISRFTGQLAAPKAVTSGQMAERSDAGALPSDQGTSAKWPTTLLSDNISNTKSNSIRPSPSGGNGRTHQTTQVANDIPPLFEDLLEFFKDLSVPDPMGTAQEFFDYYDAKGWKVGHAPMKKWTAAARNWAKRDSEYKGSRRSSEQDERARVKQAYLEKTKGITHGR